MEENKNVEVVVETAATAETKEAKPETRRGNRPQRDGKRRPQRRNDGKEREIPHTVVAIKRVSKTVKGGRSMRFSALVVCGNGQGSVGFGTGKAKEVPDAIKKALGAAKKNMYRVPMVKGDTIPHIVNGKFGACTVMLRPAPNGTGIIAGGAVRSVLELAGVKNIYSKVYGSRTSINVVRATINGIESLKTAGKVSALRGKKI